MHWRIRVLVPSGLHSPELRFRRGTRALLLCAMLTLGPASAASVDPAERAAEYARLFLAGDLDAMSPMHTDQMNAALSAAQIEGILAGLAAQQGELKSIGAAWREDQLQGFVRYRVPLEFERGTTDLRVVLDGGQRVAGVFLVPHVEPPSLGAPGAPVKEVEVTVGDTATGLPGTLSLPGGEGPHPAVVLVHGSGPNDRDETIGPNKPFRDLAWGLAERGIVVLRYDKRSLVRPDDLVAIGENLTVREEAIDDARAALALLRARDDVNTDAVFVLGHSLGGTLAPRIAAQSPRPTGIIVMAGATLLLPEKMITQTRYIAELDGEVSEAEREQIHSIETAVTELRRGLNGEKSISGFVLGAPLGYYRDLEEHDPAAEAATLGLPALVLQGSRDYQVTLEDYRRWEQALSGLPGACLRLYDGLDHLFRAGSGPSGPHDYDRAQPVETNVIEDIAAWIESGGRCDALSRN